MHPFSIAVPDGGVSADPCQGWVEGSTPFARYSSPKEIKSLIEVSLLVAFTFLAWSTHDQPPWRTVLEGGAVVVQGPNDRKGDRICLVGDR